MDANAAWARFLRSLALASNQLAADLDAVDTSSPAREIAASPETLVEGHRQQAIVAVPGLRDERGMTTSEVAKAINYRDVPNVYQKLRNLEARGLIELISGSKPQRWRLVEQFRSSPAA